MRIDTRHVGDSSIVLMELESKSEARYSDEQLARVAFSQDRLRWPSPTAGIAYAKSTKLRSLPRDRRFVVSRLGRAASVVITPA